VITMSPKCKQLLINKLFNPCSIAGARPFCRIWNCKVPGPLGEIRCDYCVLKTQAMVDQNDLIGVRSQVPVPPAGYGTAEYLDPWGQLDALSPTSAGDLVLSHAAPAAPLPLPLLDVTLPVTVRELWQRVLADSAFHMAWLTHRRNREAQIGPWLLQGIQACDGPLSLLCRSMLRPFCLPVAIARYLLELACTDFTRC
jgi:hypothetical protein